MVGIRGVCEVSLKWNSGDGGGGKYEMGDVVLGG